MGKRGKKSVHIRCRRCGHVSYNVKTGVCSYCGYGKSAKIRKYNWKKPGK